MDRANMNVLPFECWTLEVRYSEGYLVKVVMGTVMLKRPKALGA